MPQQQQQPFPQLRKRGKRKMRRFAGMIEALEPRRLLTTIIGGGYTAAGIPIANTFDYEDGGGNFGRIAVGGNVKAEFIADQFGAAPVDLFPAIYPPGSPPPAGPELFQIYVAQGDPTGYITVEQVDKSKGDPTPFGGPSAFFPNYANPNPTEAPTSAGAGSLVLGAINRPTPSGQIPFPTDAIATNQQAFGLRPGGLDDLPGDPTADLSAGLILGPGQALGKFLFDGEVMGKVFVPGDMNLFYAGWLVTGDTTGVDQGFSVFNNGLPVSLGTGLGAPRANFFVGGNLGNLVSFGPIGWYGKFGPGGIFAPHYLSGVDVVVQGRMGEELSLQGMGGTTHVLNSAGVARNLVIQQEIEGTELRTVNGQTLNFQSGAIVPPTGPSPVDDNTFATAQFLGNLGTAAGNNVIEVAGSMDAAGTPVIDPIDFYAVGLMAGQTVSVQLQSGFFSRGQLPTNGFLQLGVINPDGQLIASDYTELKHPEDVINQPFQFTADRPGAYRIVVGTRGDINFMFPLQNPSFSITVGHQDYLLTINTAENIPTNLIGNPVSPISLGGVVARGPILDNNEGVETVRVENGDLGGIDATSYYLTVSKTLTPPLPVPGPQPLTTGLTWSLSVANGNLRTLDCGQIGQTAANNLAFASGPDLNVPNGSVGLVRARTGILLLNPSATFDLPVYSVHGDYQVVDAGGPVATGAAAALLDAGIVCDGRIGVIRAGTIGGVSVITADADNKGFDGTIDLIDCTALNGPAISHGPGGDVRYIRAQSVIIDPFFQAGSANSRRVVHGFGETVQFTDDSGSTISLTPTGTTAPNPNFNPNDISNGPAVLMPRLTTQTYPIRSGGVVVLDVQSIGYDGKGNAGLDVNAQGNGPGSVAEISRIEISGSAAAPTRTINAQTRVLTLSEPARLPTQQLNLNINGSAVTDVLYIAVTTSTNQFTPSIPIDIPSSNVLTFGNATSISNTTGGEIVSINAASIGTLFSKATIGLMKSTSGAAVIPRDTMVLGPSYASGRIQMPTEPGAPGEGRSAIPIGAEFPFADITSGDDVNPWVTTGVDSVGMVSPATQTFGVFVDGDIISVSAWQGLAKIVTNGTIGSLVANSDHQDTPGVFEGINGVVWAFGGNGIIQTVNIGEGVLASGSGRYSFAGLYADQNFGAINNQGAGSDIRGNIIAGVNIGPINLNNGAIIGSKIMVFSNGATAGGTPEWDATREGPPFGFLIPQGFPPGQNHPNAAVIGPFNITGSQGGIIGSYFLARSVGAININGFGMISTKDTGPFDGLIGQITTSGYGLRDDEIGQGATITGLNATGNGSNLPTTAVTESVRLSETAPVDPVFHVAFDPFSGRLLSNLYDLHAQLGTGAGIPVINGVTDTGVLEDVTALTQRDLGNVFAQTIRGRTVSLTNNATDTNSPASPSFPMQFNIANSIGNVVVRGLVNGLRVVSGRIKSFQPASDVLSLNMQVSGTISKVHIRGNLANNSTIAATGPNGTITNLTIDKNVVGLVRATSRINTITVGGNMTGPGNDSNGNPLPALQIDGRNRRGSLVLNKMTIGGNFGAGTINIVGNIGTIQTNGDFGVAGSTFTVSGSMNKLTVGAARGGTLADALVVKGKMGTLNVTGQIGAPVTVLGNFNELAVTGTGSVGNSIINSPVFVGGTLKRADINNGVVGANISATSSASMINISNGSLAAGATIASVNQSIGTIRISHGNLFGSVHADNGSIKQIIVDGNIGDGVNPASITTNSMQLLSVGGSILKGATITIDGPLNVLFVGGNLEAGATVKAASLGKNEIQGQTLGNLIIG